MIDRKIGPYCTKETIHNKNIALCEIKIIINILFT
jgi:hypothetical protein